MGRRSAKVRDPMKAPITPPTSGAAQQQFEIQRVDAGAPEAGGRIGGVQVGFPLWKLVWTLGNVGVDRSDLWRAFMAQIRGSSRRFLGWDLGRPYPKAYPNGFSGLTRAGGGSFDGTATSWSETITADGDSQQTLNGFPAGFVLNAGDYIGYGYTATESAVAGLPWSAVTRVVEGATANGSGVITATCEPPIPAAVPSDAVATVANPKCVMVLVSDQSSLNAIDRSLGIRGGQIVGVQDIRS
jgi:hypothetical protein